MKKILYVALFLMLCFNISKARASVSSIMVDATSGDVLYAHNADEQRYPASLAKLMTLYITFNALESGKLKMDDRLKVSHIAAGRSPSRLGINAGETIDVKTCILASIVKSANDCATILGEALSNGNEREFAKLMTKTAQKLGMKNTVFKNASGLNHSEQKSTARDMAILALAIYHHFPQYYPLFSLTEFEYKGQPVKGHNNILTSFEGADGLKTGYTSSAGFNIIASAKRDGHRVIAVTMGHQKIEDRDQKVSLMMNKVFEFLKQDSQINIEHLKTALETPLGGQHKTNYARAVIEKQTNTPKMETDFGIQIGAFSSYDKAMNHAHNIQKQFSGKLKAQNIYIDKLSRAGKTMYRAQFTGLNKADASKLCVVMKNKKQDCVATNMKPKTMVAEGSL